MVAVAFSLFFLHTPLHDDEILLQQPDEQITTSADKGLVSFHTNGSQLHAVQPVKQLIYYVFDKTAVTLNLLFLVVFSAYWLSRFHILLKHRLLRPIKFTSIFVDRSPRM
ncbi:hypothetical protein [Paenibacillus thermotolerans]|uniref:hypothetical protein n=1 Tax=Paenibacillus thermotolerans TaxID=3027807 RepID=UPI00236844E0|nr:MULTISPECIES: hypothetical protein [unclassified Paenibacillus]